MRHCQCNIIKDNYESCYINNGNLNNRTVRDILTILEAKEIKTLVHIDKHAYKPPPCEAHSEETLMAL